MGGFGLVRRCVSPLVPEELGGRVDGESWADVGSAAEAGHPVDAGWVGAGVDDRLRPLGEGLEQLVEVVTEGLDDRSVKLVGAQPDASPSARPDACAPAIYRTWLNAA